MKEKIAKTLYAISIGIPSVLYPAYLWIGWELIAYHGVTEPFSAGFVLFTLALTVPVFVLAVILKRIPPAMIFYAGVCLAYAALFLVFPPRFGVP